MNFRKLGKTDMQVSPVAMGCWPIVGDATWGPQDESEAIKTIRTALDIGVNFFDTAEGYGDGYSEQLLAKGIAGQRHAVIIASKVGSDHLAADAVINACENSLRNLNSDYIDLYQIHWPGRRIYKETMTALEKLKTQGKIRAIGVSNFGRQDLPEILSIGRSEANQLPYSLLWRALEYDISPICVENDISILCYCPLMQGLLTGKFAVADDVPDGRARTRLFSALKRPQARHGEDGIEKETFAAIDGIRDISEKLDQPMASVALAWLLHQPGVTSVLAGARNPQQMKQNAQAAELKLSTEIIEALNDITEVVKVKLGRNVDMWQNEANSRYR